MRWGAFARPYPIHYAFSHGSGRRMLYDRWIFCSSGRVASTWIKALSIALFSLLFVASCQADPGTRVQQLGGSVEPTADDRGACCADDGCIEDARADECKRLGGEISLGVTWGEMKH